jgi:hypothetical protein
MAIGNRRPDRLFKIGRAKLATMCFIGKIYRNYGWQPYRSFASCTLYPVTRRWQKKAAR